MYNNFFCLLVVLIVLSLIDKTVNSFINDTFYFNLRKTESHTEQCILILRWPVEEMLSQREETRFPSLISPLYR